MPGILAGLPTELWVLLAVLAISPKVAWFVGPWVARKLKLGIAVRIATRAASLMGIGFALLAIVGTVSILATGMGEVRRRHLPHVSDLALDLDIDGPVADLERRLAAFRTSELEAGPVLAWRDACGASCLAVAADPEREQAQREWGARLTRDPPRAGRLITTRAAGGVHLLLSSAVLDARGVPTGHLVVAVRADWVAARALRTAAIMVAIAYLLLALVWVLTRRMLAASVASRVKHLAAQIASADAAGTGAAGPSDPASDELGLLAAAIRTHVGATVERERRADARMSEARSLAARMESTTTLAAGVAHDFNNLMMGVMANTEDLRDELIDRPELREALSTIIDCADRGGKLAQQLLAFARGGKYNLTVVDLNAVIETTVRLEARPLPSRVTLHRDLAAGRLLVEADPTQLGQVVANLIHNAIEAVDAGGRVTITSRHETVSPGTPGFPDGLCAGPCAVIAVHDTGPGMTDAVRTRVFDPFFTTKSRGRGMGLAASYGIVIHHGGHIRVESHPARGTTFTVYLPATDLPATPAPVPDAPGARDPATILLVDDEEAIVAPTRRLLERSGYRVLVAENGAAAIGIARDAGDEIDVILLDMRMPVMGGAEAYDSLVEACPRAKVLICSGYELDRAAQGLLDAGAAGFVPKPFLIGELVAVIKHVLGRSARSSAP